MNLPNLESLRCFDAAATLLNFRAAAKKVALSPPAFGERIAQLEEVRGASLFLRTTRQVTLTPEGHALVPRARAALDAAAACLSADSGAPWEIVLSTRFELGLSWLVPGLRTLASKDPSRTVHLHFADTPDMLSALRKGTVDCAVTSSRLVEANLSYATLHDEDYVFCASPKLLKHSPLKKPEDSNSLRLLDISADLPLFRYFLDARPAAERWAFQGCQYLGTIGAVRALALEGAGVAVLPKYFVMPAVKRHQLQVLFPKQELKRDAFRLLWRTGHPRAAQLEQLAAELRQLPIQ